MQHICLYTIWRCVYLRYSTLLSPESQPTFQRSRLPPSARSKNKANKKVACCLLSNPEVRGSLVDYMLLYLRQYNFSFLMLWEPQLLHIYALFCKIVTAFMV
jgi:hypothetical protein